MSNNESKGWLAANMEDPDFRRLLDREEIIESFLNCVDEEMEKQGISRAELARRMNCKPSNITQIMRRTRNLTVATMADIAHLLGFKLKMSMAPTECLTEISTVTVCASIKEIGVYSHNNMRIGPQQSMTKFFAYTLTTKPNAWSPAPETCSFTSTMSDIAKSFSDTMTAKQNADLSPPETCSFTAAAEA